MIRHFYFCDTSAPLPGTWATAFPGGQRIDDAGAFERGLGTEFIDIVWLRLSGDWPGALQRMQQRSPQAIWVGLSAQPSAEEAARVLDHGARGYCHLYASPVQLREVALVLAHGGWWVGPDLMASLVRGSRKMQTPQAPLQQGQFLSEREQQVAHAVAAGLSNKEVAARLNITERTVKAHLGAIFDKLGVRDRLQLALRMAQDKGGGT
jgi:DNA-binding NarL/FixJ family response regulator